MNFVMSVRLSVWISSTAIGRISLKFDSRGFLLKSVEKVEICLKSVNKVLGTLRADRSRFYCYRRC